MICTLAAALNFQATSYAAGLYDELDWPSLSIARATVQSALEGRAKGETQYWQVPGIAKGAVTPRRTWRSASGHWCRQYEENIQLADGRIETAIAVRCRSSNGRWQLVGG